MSVNKGSIKSLILIILALVAVAGVAYFVLPSIFGEIEYKIGEKNVVNASDNKVSSSNVVNSPIDNVQQENKEVVNPIIVTHIETPKAVKAAYVSAWVAGSPKLMKGIIDLVDTTELNAVVIDVKDSTGRVSFDLSDPVIKNEGSIEKRIPNIRALIDTLHKKNIYVIGRIAVFQDPYMTKKRPEWAITKLSDGTVWKDRKGLSFLDPAKKPVHDYIVALAKDSYGEGFDEVNFDYIRYPSDGDMKNIDYHLKEGETRADNIEKFFKYLNENVKKDINIPMSADLFGLTTEAKDDMGIGQVWEKALPYFDFLCPMVYPSHYPAGYMGFSNPSAHPYEVINQAMLSAIAKTNAVSGDINKIRPWLQDFNLGSIYTKDLIKAEMKAVYDNKLSSWMLWDPANTYTKEALDVSKQEVESPQ